MSTGHLPSLHAIYAVAGDVELLAASIGSIYDDVVGITIITGSDRDWMGRPRDTHAIRALVADRRLDPDHKIDLLVTDETNEARSRNRAMDFVAPRRRSLKVQRQSGRDGDLAVPDYFLIVDADELYESDHLAGLRAFIAAHPRRIYRAACARYFKRWNYRVTGLEWATVAVRSDVRFSYLRYPPVPRLRRGLNRLTFVPRAIRSRLCGFVDVPAAVSMFHHGSYIGPTSRIDEKLASFGHSHEVAPDWVQRVWDGFDPDMKDLNPVYPSLFPRVEHLEVDDLPPVITGHDWPAGYLDRV